MLKTSSTWLVIFTILRGVLPNPFGGVYGSIVCLIPKCLGLILLTPLTPPEIAAYVSGEDQRKCLEVARELRAGQISINYGSSGPSAPFGGYKQSGNGREKAEWGLGEFLEVKAIMGG